MTISVNVFLKEINGKKILISKILLTANDGNIKIIGPPCIVIIDINEKKLILSREDEEVTLSLNNDELLYLISSIYLVMKTNTRIDADEMLKAFYKITNNKKCFKILHTLAHENNIKLSL